MTATNIVRPRRDWLRSARSGAKASHAARPGARAYEPLAPPRPTFSVPDPSRRGWWDPALSPAEVRARIRGLEGMLAHLEPHPETPAGWLESERMVLAGLKRRARGLAAHGAGRARPPRRRKGKGKDPGQAALARARRAGGRAALVERNARMWALHEKGMQGKEVAATMGLSQSTVSSTLSRLRAAGA